MMRDPNASVRAPHFDPIEIARGAVSALCYVSQESSREVHVGKIHTYFERAGIAPAMTEALDLLHFLREAESLDGGYWIPAPTRRVDLEGSQCLVVGIHPTTELRRHFPSTLRAGAGRMGALAELSTLPAQSLEAWRGSDGLSADAWAQSFVDSAIDQCVPSIADDGMEALGTRIQGGAAGRFRTSGWVPMGDQSACTWRGVGLFRARTSATRYRHFLGQHRSGSGFLEGPPVHDSLRMHYGLASLQGQPLTLSMATAGNAASIFLPVGPPAALRRLLVALCDPDLQSYGRTWLCRDRAWLPVLQTALQELGCETAYHG